MSKQITIPKFYDSSFRFYDIVEGRIKHDIWHELQLGLWRQFNIDAFLGNEKEYANKVDDKADVKNKLMFPNLAIIEPGHVWNAEKKDTEIEYTSIKLVNDCNRKTLRETVERYFSQFNDKKLGVHLSGGLDSSLIMAWLHEIHIPFTAIGFKSERWEFRTERRIQGIMAEKYAEDALLLDVDQYPFYSDLDGIPKTQTPYSACIKNWSINNAIADKFKSLGVDIVFSGQGGDTLFVDPIDENKPLAFAIGDEFEVYSEDELVYEPLGMQLQSPFADIGIIQQISSLRVGEKQDVQKWWARQYFHDLLPKELSEFCYAADMFGLSQSGLEEAKPTIKKLFEEAYDLMHNHNFSSVATKRFLDRNVFELEFKTYIEYTSYISVAAWLHALFRY